MDDIYRVSGRVTAVICIFGILQASSYSGMAPTFNAITTCPRRRGIENLVRSRNRMHDRVGAGNSICRSAVTTGGGQLLERWDSFKGACTLRCSDDIVYSRHFKSGF